MAYLHRKIDSFLERWRNDPDRLPLIIRGARQVGKTESIRRFAHQHYESVVEVNFVEDPLFRSILDDGYRVDAIISNLSLIDPSLRFDPGRTLLFFDEMQEQPDIATALKFFALDGRFDVICSGSMLGINYGRIESNSVGYKTDYELRSMDFEEYLWARGHAERVASVVDHMASATPFSPLEMDVLSKLFLDFCILGGMPAVVARSLDMGTFEGTLGLQRQLIADYREDVQKYAQGTEKTRILNVFESIPAQLARENKKFQAGKVARGASLQRYLGSIEWLQVAGIVELCHRLHFPELPLRGNVDPSSFKVYFADTGMLVAMLDDEAAADLRGNRNLGVYKGALYENMAADAFVKQGLGLYYYKRENSTLEEDFFARMRDRLVPIEVKARGGQSKSLRTLIDDPRYSDVAFGVKFHGGNVGVARDVYTFPHFCLFKLRDFLTTLE